MAQQYVSKLLTATNSAQSAAMNTEVILLVANDSTSVDLMISFESDTASDYITLKPGEQIKNIELQCANLYYKTLSSTAVFRVLGLNK